MNLAISRIQFQYKNKMQITKLHGFWHILASICFVSLFVKLNLLASLSKNSIIAIVCFVLLLLFHQHSYTWSVQHPYFRFLIHFDRLWSVCWGSWDLNYAFCNFTWAYGWCNSDLPLVFGPSFETWMSEIHIVHSILTLYFRVVSSDCSKSLAICGHPRSSNSLKKRELPALHPLFMITT